MIDSICGTQSGSAEQVEGLGARERAQERLDTLLLGLHAPMWENLERSPPS